ncbi:tRNA (adenosine(37)-N6)-threonylcarbamoyltransferase complex ATPase subunit type 1 TsaE [Microbacterium sp. NPDC089695]|uniref:tRNA (adenosine(37)-N6)-threonylcarbamoyltransferase complex ATPase subunit type 1 TsaE n=1 Tax=Microbacterium sp. NPDC089695 TaxID=3364198 RepID=UPI003812DBF6
MSVDPAFLGRHEIDTAGAMEQLGFRIGEQLGRGDLLILTGPLGAGKTTFTRGLAEGLGVRGPVQSPTFVIARTHPSLVGRAPLVHVDAYRLGSGAELEDLDIDLDRSVVVIEWGRGMAEDLAESWWDIELERPVGVDHDVDPADLDSDAPRHVTIAHGRRAAPPQAAQTTLEG